MDHLSFSLVFLIVAIVLFAVASVGWGHPRYSQLIAAGLAFLAAAHLPF